MTLDDIPVGAKHLIDAFSLTALLGTLVNILPHIATGLTVIWSIIRIYETDTVQQLLGRVAEEERDV
ncbi:hypothetical protein [Novosphingobium mangrovi (ex Hu et al. 2023)]|uniref:MotA/TolQ/ExbB proton channel domain-containing protein n=1 Tax=Novosphingobium mangrovi (ex Hu et al. 2023) TaxID=2930094 RepID=A0ABT0A8X7_9SPHN|nr:hypothetical protein [Novosphingobium mangrovi (ex Hu et al. 2023)]MCJ1959645.1 hypothetical protein [Novosphingobium mangrovi (ex Hu et al. 2023)]